MFDKGGFKPSRDCQGAVFALGTKPLQVRWDEIPISSVHPAGFPSCCSCAGGLREGIPSDRRCEKRFTHQQFYAPAAGWPMASAVGESNRLRVHTGASVRSRPIPNYAGTRFLSRPSTRQDSHPALHAPAACGKGFPRIVGARKDSRTSSRSRVARRQSSPSGHTATRRDVRIWVDDDDLTVIGAAGGE